MQHPFNIETWRSARVFFRILVLTFQKKADVPKVIRHNAIRRCEGIKKD